MWVRVTRLIYLACKDSTQTNYDQDVEDSWAHDCADANVTFSDEDTWKSGFVWRQIKSVCHSVFLGAVYPCKPQMRIHKLKYELLRKIFVLL